MPRSKSRKRSARRSRKDPPEETLDSFMNGGVEEGPPVKDGSTAAKAASDNDNGGKKAVKAPDKRDERGRNRSADEGAAEVTGPSASDDTIPIQSGVEDINRSEAGVFLKGLKSSLERTSSVGIYFHNDMDGLNGALFVRKMVLGWFGQGIEIHASPIEYHELSKLVIDENIVYVFIDIGVPKEADNLFRIDHHGPKRNSKEVGRRILLLTPSERDYEYPSTATGLCAYLDYIAGGGKLGYLAFLTSGPWHKDPFTRILILLASVCDNLWHLNFRMDIPIKRWVSDEEEVRYLILASISASLLLGDDDQRRHIVETFFRKEPDPHTYIQTICKRIAGAQNMLEFTLALSKEAEKYHNEIFFNLTQGIETTLNTLIREKETWKHLEASMPIDMRGNREKMMELLKTRGDPSDEHWKRIEFYGKEMEKVEAKIKVEEKKLLELRRAKGMISTEKGPKLCVYLPQQSSRQTKGIVASLLYYLGWKNVILEARGANSTWGARGFTREEVDSYFSTLSLGFEDLKKYLFMEKVYRDLPEVFKRTLNISRYLSFDMTYTGGMGGRGMIFGGSLSGKVPRIFSILEESGEAEEKIKELMLHKELGNALQGFTEGESTVSTAQALRSKFKNTGWITIQLIGGSEVADVIRGNFTGGMIHLAGYTRRFQVSLNNIPPDLPQMEHSVFDGVLD